MKPLDQGMMVPLSLNYVMKLRLRSNNDIVQPS